MSHVNQLMPAATVLEILGWLPEGQSVTAVEIAGAGNMNRVERLRLTDGGSLILKRAQPWVEKYPDIRAPVERAAVEAAFYTFLAGTEAAAAMPQHLGFDQPNAANLFEDLGEASDGMAAYQGTAISEVVLDAVIDWMAALHALPVPSDPLLSNAAMRALNAEHIFRFPLDATNGFDLDAITPGLATCATHLKRDAAYSAAVASARDIYLGNSGGVLLHGDLYPGSWLVTPGGIRIIDPEFCWVGPREWDVGILAAHLILSGQSPALRARLFDRYPGPIDRALANRFAGIEIMRRLIGVAQLPLAIGIGEKAALLNLSRTLVLGESE